MDELDFDPNVFVFDKIWHIVNRDSIFNPTDKGPGFVQGQTADGRLYILAFTDVYLAQEFVDNRNDPTIMAYEVPSLSSWLAILEYLNDTGHEHIGIDPKTKHRFQLRTIRSAIEFVRSQVKGEQTG